MLMLKGPSVTPDNFRIFSVWFLRFCSFACTENDLLCTHASPSLLPLLSRGFGIHLSSLNRLNASDGSFWLTRYISGPDVYTMKVLQYFYIKRSVSKGPIHTLLNNIAMSLSMLLTLSSEVDLRYIHCFC